MTTIRLRTVVMLIALTVISVNSACGDAPGKERNVWHERRFTSLGIELSVPGDAVIDWGPRFGVLVSLRAKRAILAETKYRIEIVVKRISPQEFANNLKGTLEAAPERRDGDWQIWMASEHSAIEAKHGQNFSYYRFDRRCSNDDVLSMSVEEGHTDRIGATTRKEDQKTIERILLSARCVDRR